MARPSRKPSGSATLHALASSALALPGVAGNAAADAPADRVFSDYRFSWYTEHDIDSDKATPGSATERYEIQTHQIRLAAPVADRFDLGLDLMYETMSGATPWYVIPDANNDPAQVMTGATIEEERTDALLSGSYYLDRGRVGLSTGVSVETDYLAINGGIEGERHFNEKNTTLSSGFGFSVDTIEPTDAESDPFRPSKEERQSYSVSLGLSQVLGRGGAVQSTLNYQHSRGFLSDPYKRVLIAGTPVGDSRPDTRNQFAWLTRYRQHVESLHGSLHFDYRFAIDDWDINSHTFELAWYQGLWRSLRIVPAFRYYSQSQADFYAPWFLAAPSDGFASSDYRLSPYGALSWRVRTEGGFSTGNVDWKLALSYEQYYSSADWALSKVAVENPGLVSFDLLSVTLGVRF